MTSHSYQHIRVTVSNGVAHISLARPEKLNALGIGPGSNREELCHALATADTNDDVGCILLTGEGKSFCGGGDLSGTTQDPDDPYDALIADYHFNDAMNRFYADIRSVKKPIVAAVQGYCLGAGLGLASHCDLVIASDNARFGLVEGRIGMPGAVELVPLIGRAWAKFMIFTGELLDAETAREIGLALTVVPAEELEARSRDLAERIARMPRNATILNKSAIDKTADANELAGRSAGRKQDIMTKFLSQAAQAPDGRRFSDILKSEGLEGLKKAREAQYTKPWLPKGGNSK